MPIGRMLRNVFEMLYTVTNDNITGRKKKHRIRLFFDSCRRENNKKNDTGTALRKIARDSLWWVMYM